MAQVSISEAARLSRRSRTTLYRYKDEGKLSFSVDSQGNPVIDTAELIRVFGTIELDSDKHYVTHESDSVRGSSEKENPLLLETVRRLEQELADARQREVWLQGQMERLTLLLTHNKESSKEGARPSGPWWKFW
jgi:DNA-binding transcriptional MerR regulator